MAADPVERLLGSLATQIEELDWQAEQYRAFNEEIDEAGDNSTPNSPSILQPPVFVPPSRETTVRQTESVIQRFRSVSDEETAQFVDSNRNQNTVRKTCGNLKILNAWLEEENEHRQIHEIPPEQLNKYLARYFLSVVKQDGKEYEPETLRSHLGSFSRHLKEKNYAENIIESDKFKHTRDVLASKMKDLKKKGLGNKKRKAEALEDDDFEILCQKNLLGAANPEALINSVYFNNSMHFGLRGRHEHEQMLWGDVELKTSASGQEYLEFTERATKTRNGISGDTRPFAPKMFAKPGDSLCPVNIYKEYKKRRPESENNPESRFYLSINRFSKDSTWFKRQPMGKNLLGSLVKQMTEKAGLTDKRLTNHSSRKTAVTKLINAGFQPTEVMQLTGHKNAQSINNYSSLSMDKQKTMSNTLSNIVSPARQMDAPSTSSASIQELDTSLTDDTDLNEVMQAISSAENPPAENQPQYSAVDLPIHVTNQGFNLMSNETWKTNPLSMFHSATINGNINMNFYAQQK